jgi:hypothetical protein
VQNTSSWGSGGLQIRHNKESNIEILWSGLISRNASSGTGSIFGRAGNQAGTSSNLFKLPTAQTWSGSWGTTTTNGFLSNSGKILPEQRRYIWTTTTVTDKTVYYLTLMAGASDNTQIETTNIFMKIEQIQAN